ncbi:hypothetical protein CUU27_21835 [Salmonella enterica subsp. enterica serovar Heidelberg]|nr:hypothetical protein [Salmonella enterica subsp. enterica serovar Heidelberg]EDS3414454.1 hypothetical protein [Salmonella enterica]
MTHWMPLPEPPSE